jgi:uncharacterized protein (DUF2267 family)
MYVEQQHDLPDRRALPTQPNRVAVRCPPPTHDRSRNERAGEKEEAHPRTARIRSAPEDISDTCWGRYLMTKSPPRDGRATWIGTGVSSRRLHSWLESRRTRRISKGETEAIARELPKPLKRCLHHYGSIEKFHLDEMVRRIEQKMGLDRRTAQRVLYAVLVALRRSVGVKHFADLRVQLPQDFMPLLDAVEAETPPPAEEESPFIGPLSLEEFLDRVAERAGLDRERARTATEAVLEVTRPAGDGRAGGGSAALPAV